MLESLGARVVLVRRADDLLGADGARLDALVLPGGESSAQDRLLRLLDLAEPLREVVAAGVPVLGTCAGLILLSREVSDPAPGQRSLGLLDVAVRRNAFGAQLVSTEAAFLVDGMPDDALSGAGDGDAVPDEVTPDRAMLDTTHPTGAVPAGTVRGALIRAPEIVSVGAGARTIVRHDGRILGAVSVPAGATPAGRVTGIAFHPELSGDPAFHRALLAPLVPAIPRQQSVT